MSTLNNIADTPLMRQYLRLKKQHPDAILLFRVGDFYETFSDDAIKTSKILGITLTKRANGAASYVELAGFPHHALDNYLPKLVRAGQRVAICEQLEDPKLVKTIVKRGVTELVTPGVTLNDNILDNRENNYLACVHLTNQLSGVAFLDISTGEFYCAEGNTDYIDKLLNNFSPKEVLHERGKQQQFKELFGSRFYTYMLDDWMFTTETSIARLLKQFDTNSLKGFGVNSLTQGSSAAGAVLHYLDMTQHDRTAHIVKLSRIEEEQSVWLDKFTMRNLELFGTVNENGKTLLDIIDRTQSPMGSRMLKRWVSFPLKHVSPINERLNMVEYFVRDTEFKTQIESYIQQVGDIERVTSKIASLRVNPREVRQIAIALSAIEHLKNACAASNDPYLQKVAEQLNPCISIRQRIEKEVRDDAPAQIQKGDAITAGVSAELDELRYLRTSSKEYLTQMEERQSKITGIPSLKISYNNVFGYYFEVRNTHKQRVPAEWIRKQTLSSAERYITEELKEYETKILGAEEKILEIETRLFNELVLALADYIQPLQLNASLVARLDCLVAFAIVAVENKYTRPAVNDTDVIDIKQGRHPVIEKQLPIDEPYIANDVLLDSKEQQIIIITGPNMAGKSALLRQTALIVLLSQIGCFVPAQSASVGVVDKIFTRVGASDNISQGESTFMVEMNEAASIINNLSHRSLVLFDELGRGTSTYDGISIAWAIVEYIHENSKARAKTLFATHYHELNEMESTFARIKNYNVSVRELENKVIFLRKLVRGGSEHSFGIHVARMAGMPPSVIARANEILKELEEPRQNKQLSKPVADIAKHRPGYQLSFFQLDDPVLKQIRDQIQKLDVNALTPIEALNKLNDIKKIAGL